MDKCVYCFGKLIDHKGDNNCCRMSNGEGEAAEVYNILNRIVDHGSFDKMRTIGAILDVFVRKYKPL